MGNYPSSIDQTSFLLMKRPWHTRSYISFARSMAPRLSRPPDSQDPAYQRLENRINLGVHCALFGAVNSGSWFVRNILYADWSWTIWLTSLWLIALVGHGIWMGARQKVLDLKIEKDYGKLG
jgi:hypothetical protein